MFGVGDLVRFEPDVEEELGDEAVDSLLEGVPAGGVDALLQSEEDIKEPGHVGVEVIAAHDEHIEHVGRCLLHDVLEGGFVGRIFLADDGFGLVQSYRRMGVIVMGAIGLDVVFPPARHDDGVRGKQPLPIGRGEDLAPFPFDRVRFFFGKVAAIVAKADVVGIEIFPSPIEPGKLAVVRIFEGNIVPAVVPRMSQVVFPGGADVQGQVNVVFRHPIFFMRGDEYDNFLSSQSFFHVWFLFYAFCVVLIVSHDWELGDD